MPLRVDDDCVKIAMGQGEVARIASTAIWVLYGSIGIDEGLAMVLAYVCCCYCGKKYERVNDGTHIFLICNATTHF